MTGLRVLAVDDEALALRRLELLIGRLADVELVGTAREGKEALARIAELRPDVLLLDIKMGDMDGFAVVDALHEPDVPLVIFVTAYDDFAARAFEVSAVDYLVKPVELERLRAAFARANATLLATEASWRVDELKGVVAALRREPVAGPALRETDIWAQRRGEFVRVRIKDVDWVEAERDYVHLHAGERSYMLRETLAAMHERLGEADYVRIRRSALVRLDRVAGFKRVGYGHYRMRLVSGCELRVGRTFLKRVRDTIASNGAARAAGVPEA